MHYLYSLSLPKFGRWALIRRDFPPEKFYFEIFLRTNSVSITFGLIYIYGQSLKEIDWPRIRTGGYYFSRGLAARSRALCARYCGFAEKTAMLGKLA